MAYGLKQDLLDGEGQDLVYVIFDRNRDGTLDDVAITKCGNDAQGEMDGYISARYPLPLATNPPWAKQIWCDITLYRGARAADALTTELRQRYDDALTFLRNLAAGRVGLGLPETPQNPIKGGELKSADILVSGNERVFTRSGMRDF